MTKNCIFEALVQAGKKYFDIDDNFSKISYLKTWKNKSFFQFYGCYFQFAVTYYLHNYLQLFFSLKRDF